MPISLCRILAIDSELIYNQIRQYTNLAIDSIPTNRKGKFNTYKFFQHQLDVVWTQMKKQKMKLNEMDIGIKKYIICSIKYQQNNQQNDKEFHKGKHHPAEAK